MSDEEEEQGLPDAIRAMLNKAMGDKRENHTAESTMRLAKQTTALAWLFGEESKAVVHETNKAAIRATFYEFSRYVYMLADTQHPKYLESMRLLGQCLTATLACLDPELVDGLCVYSRKIQQKMVCLDDA